MVQKIKEAIEKDKDAKVPTTFWGMLYKLITCKTKEFLMVLFSITLCLIMMSIKFSCDTNGTHIEKHETKIPGMKKVE